MTTHGMRGSRTYLSWRSMKSRCLNPKDPAYPRYGGRGIRVTPTWLSFEGFLADMGVRPDELELDRIDVSGDYEPANCRWATRLENARNKRGTKRYTAFGVTATLVELAELHRVHKDTVAYRMRNLGVGIEEALTAGPRSLDDLPRLRATLRNSKKTYELNGESLLLVEVAERIRVPRSVLSKRLQTHSFDVATTMPYRPRRVKNANT